MSYKWIRASEIGNYVYCRRAWWLREARGLMPHNTRALEAGTQYHAAHGRGVLRARLSRTLAYGLFFLAFAVVVFRLLGGVL